MIIGLFRHGESQANVQDLLSSNPTDEFHLTEGGKEQVQIIKGDEFLKQLPAAIYSSPFFRTLESASILQESIKAPLLVDPRISEMGFGLYSGKPVQETDFAVRETFRRAFAGDFLIRMSETGESRKQFFLRTYSFLASLLQQYDENDRILVVTHSSVIAVLEKLWIRLINPSFVRESTKNAQLKQLLIHKEDIKLIQQEINSLLFDPMYSENQFMNYADSKLVEFVPMVQYVTASNDAALIYHLSSDAFYEESAKDIGAEIMWFAGLLKTTHLFSSNLSSRPLFVHNHDMPEGRQANKNLELEFVAAYCKKFYPNS